MDLGKKGHLPLIYFVSDNNGMQSRFFVNIVNDCTQHRLSSAHVNTAVAVIYLTKVLRCFGGVPCVFYGATTSCTAST